MNHTNTQKVKDAEAALKGIEAKLAQSEQELASTVFERDALQKAINTKATSLKLVKIHIDGLLEVEQTVGPGDDIAFTQHKSGNGYTFTFHNIN